MPDDIEKRGGFTMNKRSFHQALGTAHAEPITTRLNHPVFRRQRGASAIEYAIIASVIALGIFVAAGGSEGAITTAFTNFFAEITAAL